MKLNGNGMQTERRREQKGSDAPGLVSRVANRPYTKHYMAGLAYLMMHDPRSCGNSTVLDAHYSLLGQVWFSSTDRKRTE